MRWRSRRHGAWFLALTAALSGCAPLTHLPVPPQGPLTDPGAATPPSAGPVAAPVMPTPEIAPQTPEMAPPTESYSEVEKAPVKRKGKRQAEHDTKDAKRAFDDFFKGEEGDG